MEREPLTSSSNITREELDKFDRILRDAHDKPWWRLFIKQIELRRPEFLSRLSDRPTELTQRQKDKLRGMINECNFTIALDEAASRLVEEQGKTWRLSKTPVQSVQLEFEDVENLNG